MSDTHNFSGTLDSLAFLDQTIGTEEHNTNLASFQVHTHALDTRGEPILLWVAEGLFVQVANLLDKLLSLDIGHTVDTSDTITVVNTR
jgi:hypothetical protein